MSYLMLMRGACPDVPIAGLLFFHFKNKEELLKTMQTDWMEKLWAAIIPMKDETLKPLICLEELLDKILQTLIDHESEYQMHYSLLLK